MCYGYRDERDIKEDIPPELRGPQPPPLPPPRSPTPPPENHWRNPPTEENIITAMKTKVKIFHHEVEKETLRLIYGEFHPRIAELDEEMVQLKDVMTALGIL